MTKELSIDTRWMDRRWGYPEGISNGSDSIINGWIFNGPGI